MGWLFTYGTTRKEMVAERSENWERTRDNIHIKSTCLAHCYRGGRFSGVLWTVWEIVKTEGDQTSSHRYIGCDLLQYRGSWGYKDMCESAGPFYYSCPLGYLKMVPVANAEWRKGVEEYHAKINAKRANTRARRKVTAN